MMSAGSLPSAAIASTAAWLTRATVPRHPACTQLSTRATGS
jgi:hypothetical protein